MIVWAILVGFVALLISAMVGYGVGAADGYANGCPYTMQACRGGDSVMKDAIDLINRQKEEIERLKAEAECADGYADALVERTKTEAIKEFAERLKNATLSVTLGGKYKYDVITKEGIDNLVKELTE